jgi:hypothetical protein
MELPDHVKRLYRHWDVHTTRPSDHLLPEQIFTEPQLFEPLSDFVTKRISIWKKKTAGEEPPYTADPILRAYRFCNIFREFDRQTIEFHTLLNPLRDSFSLWLLNMFYCRLVARPETIHLAGLLSFDSTENAQVYEKLLASPRPRFGTPYVFPVSVILKSETPTRESFITKYLPSVMKEVAKEIESWDKQSVYVGVQKVLPLFRYNLNFLWTETLIDVAYQFSQYIDLFGDFPIGPGSAPTMQRINRKEYSPRLVTQLAHIAFDTGVTYNVKTLVLSAENWEGIGCEFRKYTNLKAGKGRRRLFQSTRT